MGGIIKNILNKFPKMLILLIVFLLAVALPLDPAIASCGSVTNPIFCEDFESGASPFDFDFEWTSRDIYNESSLNADCGGNRGKCWQEIFKPGITDTYFGFSWAPDFSAQRTIFARFYVRYGDSSHPYVWTTAERSHELKFPDFGESSDADRIIGKHRAVDATHGYFRVYAPGFNHDLPTQLVSNTWYCIEFQVTDNGNNDVVKIWLDKNNVNDPDYSYTSTSNQFTSDGWNTAGWEWAYRNHAVSSNQYYYFDDVAISASYIGCSGGSAPDTTPPAAPSGLNVN